jgi:hypothetical protein
MHPAANGNKAAGNNFPAGGPAQGAPNGAPNGAPDAPPALDPFSTADFGDLTFAGGDGPDVLENFDFDSFLHNTDDTNTFGNFDFMNIGMFAPLHQRHWGKN